MNTKTLLLSAFISMLLLSAAAGTLFVHLGKANPYSRYFPVDDWIYSGTKAPDENTKPPTISFFGEKNDTVYGADVVSLSLNVSIGNSTTASWSFIEKIYYTTDWQSNAISVYEDMRNHQPDGVYTTTYLWLSPSRTNVILSTKIITEFSETINITGIPDGNHTLMVYAVESGKYPTGRTKEYFEDLYRVTEHYYYRFEITSSSLFRFSVDTTPPEVSVLSPENMTCYSPETPLNFTVNEESPCMFYSLDGQENVAIAGNTTLKNLPVGEHNVTVYATDAAGHTGASETICFTVAEPFPTTMVVAPMASVAFVGAGLLVYFKKRKK